MLIPLTPITFCANFNTWQDLNFLKRLKNFAQTFLLMKLALSIYHRVDGLMDLFALIVKGVIIGLNHADMFMNAEHADIRPQLRQELSCIVHIYPYKNGFGLHI